MRLEDKNPQSHVSWCWKQKRGIKLEEPNDNLCKAYIEKAKSALNMLDSAIEKDEIIYRDKGYSGVPTTAKGNVRKEPK